MAVETPSESVMDPTALTLAGVYAEALLGLLKDDAQAEEIAAEMDAATDMMNEVRGFHDLLVAAMISKDERRAIVRRVFGGRCSPLLQGLLDILARNDRMSLVRGVFRQFRKLLNARQGKVDVTVVASVELDLATIEKIQNELRQAFGVEPLLDVKTDPSLLGGLVVKIGDRVFDASVASQLKRFRHSLAGRRRA